MSAPHIPNLLAGRGRGRGRGRGGSRGGGVSQTGLGITTEPSDARFAPPPFSNAKDRTVQRTDCDANDSRLSAVVLGYLNDEYAMHFQSTQLRRQPIINRGTYVRTSAIDTLVYAFLSKCDGMSKQIISLGAGSDTRYWRLREDKRHNDLIYHELDFQDITTNKMHKIARAPALIPPEKDAVMRLMDPKACGNFYSPTYNIHGVDLRNMPKHMENLKLDCPTLLISECCLCYLDPAAASNVINYFTREIPNIGIIIYEPTNPTSSFGQIMKSNLAARGLSMPTLNVYGSLEAQKERLRQAGFGDGQEAADIAWLWKRWVRPQEKERLDKIETLDEVEEWDLLASHYLITWGFRDADKKGTFSAWNRFCPGPGSRPGY